MNHHQRKVLHAIFAHPVNANLDLKDVTNVLTGLGAEIDAKAKSRIGVTLNGQSTILHLTNHSLLKAEVMQVRKFLEILRDRGRGVPGLSHGPKPARPQEDDGMVFGRIAAQALIRPRLRRGHLLPPRASKDARPSTGDAGEGLLSAAGIRPRRRGTPPA